MTHNQNIDAFLEKAKRLESNELEFAVFQVKVGGKPIRIFESPFWRTEALARSAVRNFYSCELRLSNPEWGYKDFLPNKNEFFLDLEAKGIVEIVPTKLIYKYDT
jgi:hypothetical protein